LTEGYEQEQADAAVRIKILKAELKKDSGKLYTADSFLEIVRYYMDVVCYKGCLRTLLIYYKAAARL